MGESLEPLDGEYPVVHRSVKDPDGRAYEVFVHSARGVAGPGFLGAEEGAPRVAHLLVNLVNRGLALLPRKPTSFTFPIVYVLVQVDDGVRQVQMVSTSDMAEAEAVVTDLVARIESGGFVPDESGGLVPDDDNDL